jgi:hypothetical protein
MKLAWCTVRQPRCPIHRRMRNETGEHQREPTGDDAHRDGPARHGAANGIRTAGKPNRSTGSSNSAAAVAGGSRARRIASAVNASIARRAFGDADRRGDVAKRRGASAFKEASRRARGRTCSARICNRRSPCRSRACGGHGLATDPPALRGARADLTQSEVTPNRSVALAMVRGPDAGLDLLSTLDRTSASPTITACTRCVHTRARCPATRQLRGRAHEAATRRTTSLPEQRYPEARARRRTLDRHDAMDGKDGVSAGRYVRRPAT